MSDFGEEYCQKDRLSYRQNHQIATAASAPERYHTPSYDVSNVRHFPVYEPATDYRRLLSSAPAPSSPQCNTQDRLLFITPPFSLSNNFDLHDHRLPPLPQSPNHYVLGSEEPPFIPPPDRYLSPPAPAPPDRLQNSLMLHDRFLLSPDDPYSLVSTSESDNYKNANCDRDHERYSADKYISCVSPENHLNRYPERYVEGSSNSEWSSDDYMRQDHGYDGIYYRSLNSYYSQKINFSSQRYACSSGKNPSLHTQYQTLKIQKCCNRDISPGVQSRIRSNRTSSPVSIVLSRAADILGGSSSNFGRFARSSFSSTLPRCNSYGDVKNNTVPVVETLKSTRIDDENCCSKRWTSSPSASSAYSTQHFIYYPAATTAVSASTTISPISSQSFHQPVLPQVSSTWKSIIPANSASVGNTLQQNSNNLSTPANISSNAANNTGSNANSSSMSISSSWSSASLTTTTTNNIATATTLPTATSTNSGSSGSTMNPYSHQVHWLGLANNGAEEEDVTASPSTEVTEDSLPGASPLQHRSASPAAPSHQHRNPHASLPLPINFDKASVKYPLQHQLSAPVTATEVASSRRYSRSLSTKEMIKNYLKKETAVFFGVHEPTEENERARWLDRTKRLAYRTYGKLKNEYQLSSTCSPIQKPDVLPLSSTGDERDAAKPLSIESTLKRKPSVAIMTYNGVAYVVSTLRRHKRRQSSTSRQWSKSYAPSSIPPTPSSPVDDEVFFDKSTSANDVMYQCGTILSDSDIAVHPTSSLIRDSDQIDGDLNAQHKYTVPSHKMLKEKYYKCMWLKDRTDDIENSQIGMSRIRGRLHKVLDNSDRRQYGMGIVGKLFDRSLNRSVMNKEPVKEQLEDLEDHRPFFTYWVTTVQILILALSIFAYGLGPVGFDLTQRSGLVLVTSLSLQQVEYSEPSNFWVGPRAADLIHMGAKFAPCMRKDKKIIKEIEKIRERERDTACCVRNDDSGCVQASQTECSQTISTWKKWPEGTTMSGGRKSGSVCGLDPKFCEAPASVASFEWPDDITKWPICRKINARAPVQTSPYDQHRFQKDKMTAEHMVCEVIGHPCCIGIHGTCRITTKEYCDFARGYFHEEASLCSQVSCLDDVCGMIAFYFPEVPDQFYRLWTSLFIHAGIIHLTVTVVIQYFLMRDLEKLTGAIRIGFIYIGSGVVGNLASAIFVPYRADVGPAGAQFGLLACLIVEVLNCWPMLRHPLQALFKLLTITFTLFLFGLLPWIDNFAHLFGFVFGFLLSYALLPFVTFGPYDRQKKIFLIWVCLLSSLFLFILLVILFYLIPIYDCKICQYFNCIPLTRNFCASQNINFKGEEYVV